MSHAVETEKPNVSSSAALWAVLIFVGLIVAAINFVQAESNTDAHGGHGAATEHHEGGAGHHEHNAAGAHGAEAQDAQPAGSHEQSAPAEGHGAHEAQPAHEAPAQH